MSEPRADPVPAPPAAEIEAAARRVVAAAIGDGLRVRLMGGLAIRIQSPSAARPPYERSYRDFDLVARGRDVARPILWKSHGAAQRTVAPVRRNALRLLRPTF